MKKTIFALLVLMMGWISAEAQNANPFISVSASPSVVPIPSGGSPGGNSNLQIIIGNAGANNIAVLSMEVSISVGFNAEILPGIAGGSDARWTVVPGSLVPGPNGSVKLRNTAGPAFTNSDLGIINLTIRAVAAGGPALIGGNVSYIFGVNPNTGAQSSAQGNTSPADDNSASSLTVSSVLPVGLSDIYVIANSCNGLLNWKTSSEENLAKFEVEYSKNGVQFTTVGTVAAKNSSTGFTYKYVNDQGTGRGFYRLKMVDKDGTIAYSRIVSVDTKCNGTKSITLYPNPVIISQNLTVIATGYEGSIKGDLVSMSGQIVRTYTLKNGTNLLPVDNIAQATYMLKVTDASGTSESFRLVIMK